MVQRDLFGYVLTYSTSSILNGRQFWSQRMFFLFAVYKI